MNTKLVTIPLLLLGLTGCATDTGTAKKEEATAQPQDVTVEFRPLADKMVAAWSTLDASKAAPYYAKDADLAFFDATPLKYKGWQEYADGFSKATGDWKSLTIAINPDFRATREGNVVWATCTAHFEMTPKKGNVMSMDGRMTEIWEKRGDTWLSVHEHVSVPMPETPAPTAKKPAGRKK